MRVIPAGVSKKTGKPYRAFEICEKIACKQLKEASRYNVPPSSQNASQGQFNPLQPVVDDLQKKVDALNQVIANMRTAYASLDSRIKKLEIKDEIDIPVVEPKTTVPGIDITFPEGFLK